MMDIPSRTGALAASFVLNPLCLEFTPILKWRGGAITLQFSEPMEPSTLMQVLSNDPKQLSTSTTILLLYGGLTSTAQVPAKVSCADTSCWTVTLEPDARLAKRKTYSDTEGTTTTIKGTLKSAPRKTFIIQFFSSPGKDSSGFGEGKEFMGKERVTTNREGRGSFTFPTGDIRGAFVTATATRLDPTSLLPTDTSEFSKAVMTK